MTRSNRVANRLFLVLVGLVSIVVGAALAVRAGASHSPFDLSLPFTHAVIAHPNPTALWITVAASLVVVVLCLLWIFSRGRGRTSTIVTVKDTDGTTSIDTRVAADLVSDALADNPDVVSVGSGGYLMRRSRVLSFRLVVRKGADLPAVIRSVDATVAQLDAAFETRLPVLLQIVAPRTAFTRSVRVH